MYGKKVILFLLMSFVMIIGFQSPKAYANIQFVDVKSSHWAKEEIDYLVSLEVIEGYIEKGKRYYNPKGVVTREQAAKMIVIASEHGTPENEKSSITDWRDYFKKAVQLGYFSEISKGEFGPTLPLTRNEMGKVLTKALNIDPNLYASYPMPFKDVKNGDPYYNFINAIYYEGITQGNRGNYNPTGNVTRAEFATFVARALDDTYRLDLPVQGVKAPNEADAIGKVISTENYLNVRSSKSTKDRSNIVGQVNKGVLFNVYAIENGWYKVSYENKFAYISTTYAQFVDENGKSIGASEKQVKTIEENVNVHSKSNASSKVIGNISNGSTITIHGTTGDWYLTMLNEIPGYVLKSQTTDLTVTEPEPEPEQEPQQQEPEPQPQPEPEPQKTEPKPEPKPEPQQPEPVPSNAEIIGRATVNNLNVRAGASTNSDILGVLNRGNEVAVLSIDGFWAKVLYEGEEGYVHKTYLKLLNQTGSAVNGRIIVIDPGHGGKDPGAKYGSATEKAIVLKVSNLVKQKLENDGAIVKMTRTGDNFPTLEQRVTYAGNNYAEMFVSIHVNSATNTSASGTETYYSISANDNEKEDLQLATNINNEIVKNADMRDRKVKRADFYVIRHSVFPSVLVELGFISNTEDRDKLLNDQYVEIFADSIYNGIVQYYSN